MGDQFYTLNVLTMVLIRYWKKLYIIGKPKYWKIRIRNKIGRVITKKLQPTSELKKYHLWEIGNYFPQCTDTPDFICAIKQ